jgi:hypothetical protein
VGQPASFCVPKAIPSRFCPSFIIDVAQVDMIADLFEASLSLVEDELRQN